MTVRSLLLRRSNQRSSSEEVTIENRTPVPVSAFAVFLASFATLVIELAAGRILAPYVGVSLYTWTSVIGVVLAGISAGAWAGGRIADRYPREAILGWLLFASAAAAVWTAPLVDQLGSGYAVAEDLGLPGGLVGRCILITGLAFFLPSFLLGTVSPVAVRLAVRDLRSSGRVVGNLYALSALGSILGTFATGFFLIAWMGTRTLLLAVAAVLAVASPLAGGLWRRGRIALLAYTAALSLLALTLHRAEAGTGLLSGAVAPPTTADGRTELFRESAYQTLQILPFTRADTGASVRALVLDRLVHAYSDREDPAFLGYDYLDVFARGIAWRAAREGGAVDLLVLGGGGYTLPRHVEAAYPEARIDAVEIDPEVTRVARAYLGLDPTSRTRIFHEDARWFVLRAHGRPAYDLVLMDVFSHLTVPYHLATAEFGADLRDLLEPQGLLLVNVVDTGASGRLLASYVRTLQRVFGRERVALVADRAHLDSPARGTFVVVAARRAGDLQPLLDSLVAPGERSRDWIALTETELGPWLDGRRSVLLTDDYAPVDDLIAPALD